MNERKNEEDAGTEEEDETGPPQSLTHTRGKDKRKALWGEYTLLKGKPDSPSPQIGGVVADGF